jgi:hypothetical protein
MLFNGEYGPSASAIAAAADSPLAIFMYFMPKKLWHEIRNESNRYHSQQIGIRADEIRKRQKKNKTVNPETKHQIRSRLRQEPSFRTCEFLHLIGLLIARMLCPHKQRLVRHWSMGSEGAVPAGTFGRFMTKNRFQELMKSIHFTNNLDPRAKTDRAWKVRSVVDCLQATFRRGYTTPPVLSFDEGIIPNRSRYNPTRQYLKDKPHKWGTKLFVTCCAETAYCLRYFFFVQVYMLDLPICESCTNFICCIPCWILIGSKYIVARSNTLRLQVQLWMITLAPLLCCAILRPLFQRLQTIGTLLLQIDSIRPCSLPSSFYTVMCTLVVLL